MTSPTITFGGIGSGMDVEGLIQGLVSVAQQPISLIQSKAASARSAITSLSDIGGLLSDLQDAASQLDTLQEVGSYKASSTNDSAVALSTNGFAQPGTYEVNVQQLAQSARRYTNAFSSANTALGQNGTLTLQIGTGDLQTPDGNILVGAATASIDITQDDTINSIVDKINGSDLRLQASTFFDGSQYRIQIRGLDTGSDNALTVNESGTTLGLNDAANIAQTAQNAQVQIDGFLVESNNNQISQAIPGLTLALKDETTNPFTVTVDTDPEQLSGKLDKFVSAYNAVINKIHQSAGFGDLKASNPLLRGDSTLRRITGQLSQSLTSAFGDQAANTLASLGVSLNNNGTLAFDQSKLEEVMATDPSALTTVLAGNDTTDGVMDVIRNLAKTLTDPTDGALSIHKQGLESRASAFDDQIQREQTRVSQLEDRLRKTFTAMDGTVSAYNAQLQYLQAHS